jgi:hypothetical protein
MAYLRAPTGGKEVKRKQRREESHLNRVPRTKYTTEHTAECMEGAASYRKQSHNRYVHAQVNTPEGLTASP